MKRLISLITIACVASAAMAQGGAPFTIVRPADGSKVREKVRILIPKNSVPPGGYIGFFLGGKFLEATKPPLNGRYYEYILDTKGRGIPDGSLNLEAVLYVDYNGEPRIVDRSSVDISVQNKANIPIPAEGFRLRYKFRNGENFVYNLMQRVSLASISARQARLGARAAQLPVEFEKIRMLYSVDNAYGNGDGLVRMQALPLKGKDHIFLTPQGATRPQVFNPQDVYPIYMRLTNTGTEVFGSAPAFIPFEGLVPEGIQTYLYAAYPLPTLPSKAVRPGDAWRTRFQLGRINTGDIHSQTTVIESIPARGEFAAVEWEMGHPCAKIVHKLDLSGGPSRISMEEVIWFALDKGKVIKTLRTFYQDTHGALPAPQGGAPNRANGATGAPPPGGAAPSSRGPRRAAGTGWNVPKVAPLEFRQRAPRRGGEGGGGGSAPPAGGGGFPGGGGNTGAPNNNNPGGGGAVPAAGLIRLTVQQIFVLEQ